jgi:F-type H+-transporting ATPase subunit b
MLDLHLELMLTVLFVFFLLLFVFNTLLYKPLLKFMTDRDESIANDLKSAKELSGNSDDLHAQGIAIIDDAKAEASAIREKAIEEAKSIASDNMATKQQKLDLNYQVFIDKLSKDKDELKSALLNEMPLVKESLKVKLGNL